MKTARYAKIRLHQSIYRASIYIIMRLRVCVSVYEKVVINIMLMHANKMYRKK